MTLEQQYERADANEQAIVARIRAAIEKFLQAHPDLYQCAANEKILFDCMRAPENDHLQPDSAASWADCYAQCRNRLIERPATRRTAPPRTVARPAITHEELDQMSAEQMARRMAADPKFEEAVNALPPRSTNPSFKLSQ